MIQVHETVIYENKKDISIKSCKQIVLIFFCMIVNRFYWLWFFRGVKMSFWELLVITNLLTIIPLYGEQIVTFHMGCSRSRASLLLNRFFLLSYFVCRYCFSSWLSHISIFCINTFHNPLGILGKLYDIKFAPFLL